MKTTVTAAEAKTQFSRLLRQVEGGKLTFHPVSALDEDNG